MDDKEAQELIEQIRALPEIDPTRLPEHVAASLGISLKQAREIVAEVDELERARPREAD